MFTKPEIANPDSIDKRAYVHFYFNGERQRFYHGAAVGLDCHPYKCTSLQERYQELERLKYHIHHLLLAGWNPLGVKEYEGVKCSRLLSEKFLRTVLKDEDISKRHLDDLLFHGERFLKYLKSLQLQGLNSINISQEIAQNYLSQTENGGYYMIIRNRLLSLFNILNNKKYTLFNPFQGTKTKKKNTKLNKAYTNEQLELVLQTMKDTNKRLYICGLLMYGCFLRPHEEIRNLKRKHFNDDLTRIILAPEENKGRDIRITPVPAYVRDALKEYGIFVISSDKFLFSVSRGRVVNDDYFTNAWKKVKKKLLTKKVIEKDHTLYSLRHTAAIRLFNKTQNLAKLSAVMGHKDVQITLTYLRSLGILLNIDESDMPDLY